MSRLRVRHEFEIQVHPPHYQATGKVELHTDVDYEKMSPEDRELVDWFVDEFEKHAAKKKAGEIPR